MAGVQNTKEMGLFRDTVAKRGPYLVFRRGVVLALPGKQARAFEPGEYVKLDMEWLDNYHFYLILVGILSDSNRTASDAAGVLATKEGLNEVVEKQVTARERRYAALAAERERTKAKAGGAAQTVVVAENAELKKQLAALEKRLKKVEGK